MITRSATLALLQELASSVATKATGKFVWQQELHVDHPYHDTVLSSKAGALLLFELLQHPMDIPQWRTHQGSFAGAAHRIAWAFLDLAHPRTRKTTSAAWRNHAPAVLDVHLHPCAFVSATPPRRLTTLGRHAHRPQTAKPAIYPRAAQRLPQRLVRLPWLSCCAASKALRPQPPRCIIVSSQRGCTRGAAAGLWPR